MNPNLQYLVWKSVAVYFNGSLCEYKVKHCHYNFPWHLFLAHKQRVTPENIDNYFIYMKDESTFPIYMYVPCGHCRLCREKRVNDWCTRCICESASSDYPPLMLTLTYDRQHLPVDGLSKRDVQLFMKRLRRSLEYHFGIEGKTYNLRYFLVGEYGKKTHRAHYHMELWNMPFISMRDGDANSFVTLWKFIRDAWQNGFVRVERCRDESGRYLMKYMMKECVVPEGKNPTFQLASRRRGIGYQWAVDHASEYYDDGSGYLQVRDRNGKIQKCPIPDYFKRLWFPCMSELFGCKVSKALHVFHESAAQLSVMVQSGRFGDPMKLLPGICDKVAFVAEKFDIANFDFDDAMPSVSFRKSLNRWMHLSDRLLDLYTHTYISTLSDEFYDGLLDNKKLISPTNLCLIENHLKFDDHLSAVQMYFEASFEVLVNAKVDRSTILASLKRKAVHADLCRLCNEQRKPWNKEAALHKIEVDTRWREQHWLEDRV